MSAGQIWVRPDGLPWVEIQTAAVDPSGWRLMVPLVDPVDAPDAPPLVVTVDGFRARVHLVTSVHVDDLAEPAEHLTPSEVEQLREAASALVAR